MSLTPAEVGFLRRLVASSVEHKRADGLAKRMSELHGIGRVVGSRVMYARADFERAEALLESRRIDLKAPQQGFTRSQAASGLSEKAGAKAVTDGLVAVVPLHMGMGLPVGSSFLAVHWEAALQWDFDVILECENLEPLTRLSEYRWLDDFVRSRRTLAVFRGCPQVFTPRPPAALLRAASKPVLGFYDFDPAGLVIAAGEPNLEALCLPEWEPLRERALQVRRPALFYPQLRAYQPTLDGLSAGPVRDAWMVLRQVQWGLDQESFPRAKAAASGSECASLETYPRC